MTSKAEFCCNETENNEIHCNFFRVPKQAKNANSKTKI